jgi:hypothetical protein
VAFAMGREHARKSGVASRIDRESSLARGYFRFLRIAGLIDLVGRKEVILDTYGRVPIVLDGAIDSCRRLEDVSDAYSRERTQTDYWNTKKEHCNSTFLSTSKTCWSFALVSLLRLLSVFDELRSMQGVFSCQKTETEKALGGGLVYYSE